MRVLIIDDVPDDRQLVRHEVEVLYPDATILELATLADLDAALSGGPVDLAVTDLALRWGSGREVFERIKRERPDCPIVMFTGSGDETTAVDLMKAGLDDYVVKSAKHLPRLRASLKGVVEAARTRSALTEREAQLMLALAHKSIVVRELHHRVRNNLQTITSLLQLRARAIGGEVAAQLDELSGRMRALSAVQLRIYETEQYDRVDFRAVLSDMAESLAAIYADGNVTLAPDFDEPLDLDTARAMPLALLCYEVILNAFKHAWPDRRPGLLTVSLRTTGKAPEIRIADDGVGFMGARVVKGLGTRLTAALASEAQVSMEVLSRPGEGATVTLVLS